MEGTTYLSTPAQTKGTPFAHRGESGAIFLNGLGHHTDVAGNVSFVGHKLCDYLLLLLGISGDIFMFQRLAIEKVRDEHDGVQPCGKEIGTLQGLTGHPEDIVDVHEANLGTWFFGDVCEVFSLIRFYHKTCRR